MLTATDLNDQNYLTTALYPKDYQRLLPHLQVVSLEQGQIIYSFGQPVEYVYFPHQALISLVAIMVDDAIVEVGSVGQEGMAGIQAVFGGTSLPHQAVVQLPGRATCIRAKHLKAEFDRSETLQKLLLRYIQALFVQVSQTAACNGLHPLEQRLARWLLLAHDATQRDPLPVTQESISQMLGVRRAGVTECAKALQKAGLIRYSRGKIAILNPKALEATACECYGVIKDEVDNYKATLEQSRSLAQINDSLEKLPARVTDKAKQKRPIQAISASQKDDPQAELMADLIAKAKELANQNRSLRQALHSSMSGLQTQMDKHFAIKQELQQAVYDTEGGTKIKQWKGFY